MSQQELIPVGGACLRIGAKRNDTTVADHLLQEIEALRS